LGAYRRAGPTGIAQSSLGEADIRETKGGKNIAQECVNKME